MSYLDLPRIHFSGKFISNPSTINNAPLNYDGAHYSDPNNLEGVELYWNPRGDGSFSLVDCTVTRIDYADGTSATTSGQDPLIGQPVTSIKSSPKFPASAMVDLDPYQQNVSEIWALNMQIGSDDAAITGAFAPISFNAIWLQCQGPGWPQSSASGSAVYQSRLRGVQTSQDTGGSKLLEWFAAHPSANLSINFNVNTHNNRPHIYSFNHDTFQEMRDNNYVAPEVLEKLEPMKGWRMNRPNNQGLPKLGDIPTQEFVVFMTGQLLTTEEKNNNIENLLKYTAKPNQPYVGATPEPFPHGRVTGTVGPSADTDPDYFVPTRMMTSVAESETPFDWTYFTPFVVGQDGTSIVVNLGNSLPTTPPNFTPFTDKLGTLHLVAFPGGEFTVENGMANKLAIIDYGADGFITQQAGIYSNGQLPTDISTTPIGLISEVEETGEFTGTRIVAKENKDGYYMRADQFVYRMNPESPSSASNPRGSTATVNIHVTQWGQPAPNVDVKVTQLTVDDATTYTNGTLGTGGTYGITDVSHPQDILTVNGVRVTETGEVLETTSTTDANGVAAFDVSCIAPGNPRQYIDGQIYFLDYTFNDPNLAAAFNQDANDKISVLVYDATQNLTGAEILSKWGRIYKIMYFLTNTAAIEGTSGMSLRNMIKVLLETSFDEVEHMPLTRDLGESARTTVTDWIKTLNQSKPS